MKAAFATPTASFETYLPATGVGMAHDLTMTTTVLAAVDPSVDVIFQMQKGFRPGLGPLDRLLHRLSLAKFDGILIKDE